MIEKWQACLVGARGGAWGWVVEEGQHGFECLFDRGVVEFCVAAGWIVAMGCEEGVFEMKQTGRFCAKHGADVDSTLPAKHRLGHRGC